MARGTLGSLNLRKERWRTLDTSFSAEIALPRKLQNCAGTGKRGGGDPAGDDRERISQLDSSASRYRRTTKCTTSHPREREPPFLISVRNCGTMTRGGTCRLTPGGGAAHLRRVVMPLPFLPRSFGRLALVEELSLSEAPGVGVAVDKDLCGGGGRRWETEGSLRREPADSRRAYNGTPETMLSGIEPSAFFRRHLLEARAVSSVVPGHSERSWPNT